MARRKPDTVKSAAKGFESVLGRGELPAGTKTSGDLAREKSDPTRYGYQPPLSAPKRPTAPAGRGGGGGAQPSRTRAPSPSLPKQAPLPPRRPSPGLTGPTGWEKSRPIEGNPFPTLAGVPDVPDPMTTAGLRPEWSVGDAGFGGGTQMASPAGPVQGLPPGQSAGGMALSALNDYAKPLTSAIGGFIGAGANAGTPPAPGLTGTSPVTGPQSNLTAPPTPVPNMPLGSTAAGPGNPTMPGAMPPGLLDPNMLKQLLGGR